MTFVLFGATGDLAKRKIYPALYNLYRDQKLPKQISVIGLGRRQVSHVDFQERIKESIETFSVIEKKVLQNSKFLDNFRYCPLDVSKPEDYERLLQVVREREEELHIKVIECSIFPLLLNFRDDCFKY